MTGTRAVQRGVLHRRARAGREPRRRRQRRMGAREGDARRTSACRSRAEARCGAAARSAGDLLDQVRADGGSRRPAHAPAPRRAAHRGRGAAAHPAAHGLGRDPRASARARRRRCARCSPTSTASAIMELAKDLAGTAGMLTRRRRDRRCDVASRLPVRPRAHDRRRHRARCSATSSPSGCWACPTIRLPRDPARRRPRARACPPLLTPTKPSR